MRLAAFQAISPVFGRLSTCLKATLVVLALSAGVRAERPSAMKLFPEETLVFVRMANAHEFGEKLQQTAMGRMMRDPQMKPFVDNLYGKAGDLYAQHAESKLGISWDDLKKLPKGEVAFGVVARDHRSPALLLLVDQGDEVSVADMLVDKALDFAEKKGGEFSKEKIGDVEVTVVRDHDHQSRMFGVFERDNTIVVATDPNVLRNVLWHWDHAGESASGGAASADGKPASDSTAPKPEASADAASKDKASKPKDVEFVPTRKLSENAHFATILRECRRKQDPPPHLVFFADPISLAQNFGRDNGGLQMVLAMMPALGIDGLVGLGGTVTYATDEYDDLAQMHVLLENPRSGILQLPAFEPGDTTPQKFVPRAIESYMAWNCNLRASYDRLSAMVDRFASKGTVDRFVKDKISDKIGIDVPHQILDNLKGRYSWMIGYDRPSHAFGHQHVLAAELKDEKAVAEALKTVIGKFPELFEEKHFGNATYYAIMPKGLKDKAEDERPANPFVAIADGYLFVGTSGQQFERCITARDGTVDRLVDSAEYTRTTAVIGRETAGTTPVMFSTGRFEETLRQWYDLLTSPKTREQIDANKAKNPILAALAETLDQQKLPPFEVLAPYFAPGGGILYDTDNGYHGISFTLRNKAEQ